MRGHFGWEYKRQAQGPRRGLPATAAVPRSPGKPAAVGRLRPGPLRGPHQLHRHGQAGPRVRPDGLAEPANLDVLRKRLHRSRGAAARAHDREHHPAGGRAVRPAGRRHAGPRASTRTTAAHFLMKLMFCMFAEDIGLLPDKLFSRILAGSEERPGRARRAAGGAVRRHGDRRRLRRRRDPLLQRRAVRRRRGDRTAAATKSRS